MFHIKDEILADLEVNPWIRLKNRIIRFITSPYRLFKSLCFITGALFWISAAIAGTATLIMLDSLPSFEEKGFNTAKSQAISMLETKHQQKNAASDWTAINQINREFLYAIVMSEDGDFFKHQGIDYDALINAIGENIKRREWSFGASTISQQTAKNLYFSEAKTLYRKLKEVITTRRIEKALNKNQILEIYFNIIEFGPDIFGIKQAAKYYFDKKPREINAAEGAFLAILMPSPRKYHFTIFQNKHMARQHRNKYQRILQDMRYKDYISPEQYQKYINWKFF